MMLFGSAELSLITQLWLIKLNYAMFSAFWTTYNLISLSLFSFHTIHGVRSLHNGLIVNVFERHSHTLSAANWWHCWALELTTQGSNQKNFWLNLPPSLWSIALISRVITECRWNSLIHRQDSFLIHHSWLMIKMEGLDNYVDFFGKFCLASSPFLSMLHLSPDSKSRPTCLVWPFGGSPVKRDANGYKPNSGLATWILLLEWPKSVLQR